MPIVESWAEYVRRVSQPLTQTQIAEKCGIAQTNIGRWLRGDPGLPKAESVVAFARAFKQNPVEALLAAGYLQPADVGAEVTPRIGRTPLREYSTRELAAELMRRSPAD